jgi:hypothetical protein
MSLINLFTESHYWYMQSLKVVETPQLPPFDASKLDYVADPSLGRGITSIGSYKKKLKCYNEVKQ